eukprot:MONOS_13268.1-p1 / transcript=MONOS_13268.1 / gene=MONOS_13268 / organism=Monocercomonoides_exilis_PA203 / gene_product=unspecified product / transcript_product=unspecified product / location=Mono_scaffold00800:19914-28329(-) / protein_length=2770 / sequence_SO=supercontig / SO=protein_coding / is_pseudo=false
MSCSNRGLECSYNMPTRKRGPLRRPIAPGVSRTGSHIGNQVSVQNDFKEKQDAKIPFPTGLPLPFLGPHPLGPRPLFVPQNVIQPTTKFSEAFRQSSSLSQLNYASFVPLHPASNDFITSPQRQFSSLRFGEIAPKDRVDVTLPQSFQSQIVSSQPISHEISHLIQSPPDPLPAFSVPSIAHGNSSKDPSSMTSINIQNFSYNPSALQLSTYPCTPGTPINTNAQPLSQNASSNHKIHSESILPQSYSFSSLAAYTITIPFVAIGPNKRFYLELYNRFVSPFLGMHGEDLSLFQLFPFKPREVLMEAKRQHLAKGAGTSSASSSSSFPSLSHISSSPIDSNSGRARDSASMRLSRLEHLALHYLDALHIQFYVMVGYAAALAGHEHTAAVCLRQARVLAAALSDMIGNIRDNKTSIAGRIIANMNIIKEIGEMMQKLMLMDKKDEEKGSRASGTNDGYSIKQNNSEKTQTENKGGSTASADAFQSPLDAHTTNQHVAADDQSLPSSLNNSSFKIPQQSASQGRIMEDDSQQANPSQLPSSASNCPSIPFSLPSSFEVLGCVMQTPVLDSLTASLSMLFSVSRAVPLSVCDAMEGCFVLEYMKGIYLLSRFFLMRKCRRSMQLNRVLADLLESVYVQNLLFTEFTPFHRLVVHPGLCLGSHAKRRRKEKVDRSEKEKRFKQINKDSTEDSRHSPNIDIEIDADTASDDSNNSENKEEKMDENGNSNNEAAERGSADTDSESCSSDEGSAISEKEDTCSLICAEKVAEELKAMGKQLSFYGRLREIEAIKNREGEGTQRNEMNEKKSSRTSGKVEPSAVKKILDSVRDGVRMAFQSKTGNNLLPRESFPPNSAPFQPFRIISSSSSNPAAAAVAPSPSSSASSATALITTRSAPPTSFTIITGYTSIVLQEPHSALDLAVRISRAVSRFRCSLCAKSDESNRQNGDEHQSQNHTCHKGTTAKEQRSKSGFSSKGQPLSSSSSSNSSSSSSSPLNLSAPLFRNHLSSSLSSLSSTSFSYFPSSILSTFGGNWMFGSEENAPYDDLLLYGHCSAADETEKSMNSMRTWHFSSTSTFSNNSSSDVSQSAPSVNFSSSPAEGHSIDYPTISPVSRNKAVSSLMKMAENVEFVQLMNALGMHASSALLMDLSVWFDKAVSVKQKGSSRKEEEKEKESEKEKDGEASLNENAVPLADELIMQTLFANNDPIVSEVMESLAEDSSSVFLAGHLFSPNHSSNSSLPFSSSSSSLHPSKQTRLLSSNSQRNPLHQLHTSAISSAQSTSHLSSSISEADTIPTEGNFSCNNNNNGSNSSSFTDSKDLPLSKRLHLPQLKSVELTLGCSRMMYLVSCNKQNSLQLRIVSGLSSAHYLEVTFLPLKPLILQPISDLLNFPFIAFSYKLQHAAAVVRLLNHVQTLFIEAGAVPGAPLLYVTDNSEGEEPKVVSCIEASTEKRQANDESGTGTSGCGLEQLFASRPGLTGNKKKETDVSLLQTDKENTECDETPQHSSPKRMHSATLFHLSHPNWLDGETDEELIKNTVEAATMQRYYVCSCGEVREHGVQIDLTCLFEWLKMRPYKAFMDAFDFNNKVGEAQQKQQKRSKLSSSTRSPSGFSSPVELLQSILYPDDKPVLEYTIPYPMTALKAILDFCTKRKISEKLQKSVSQNHSSPSASANTFSELYQSLEAELASILGELIVSCAEDIEHTQQQSLPPSFNSAVAVSTKGGASLTWLHIVFVAMCSMVFTILGAYDTALVTANEVVKQIVVHVLRFGLHQLPMGMFNSYPFISCVLVYGFLTRKHSHKEMEEWIRTATGRERNTEADIHPGKGTENEGQTIEIGENGSTESKDGRTTNGECDKSKECQATDDEELFFLVEDKTLLSESLMAHFVLMQMMMEQQGDQKVAQLFPLSFSFFQHLVADIAADESYREIMTPLFMETVRFFMSHYKHMHTAIGLFPPEFVEVVPAHSSNTVDIHMSNGKVFRTEELNISRIFRAMVEEKKLLERQRSEAKRRIGERGSENGEREDEDEDEGDEGEEEEDEKSKRERRLSQQLKDVEEKEKKLNNIFQAIEKGKREIKQMEEDSMKEMEKREGRNWYGKIERKRKGKGKGNGKGKGKKGRGGKEEREEEERAEQAEREMDRVLMVESVMKQLFEESDEQKIGKGTTKEEGEEEKQKKNLAKPELKSQRAVLAGDKGRGGGMSMVEENDMYEEEKEFEAGDEMEIAAKSEEKQEEEKKEKEKEEKAVDYTKMKQQENIEMNKNKRAKIAQTEELPPKMKRRRSNVRTRKEWKSTFGRLKRRAMAKKRQEEQQDSSSDPFESRDESDTDEEMSKEDESSERGDESDTDEDVDTSESGDSDESISRQSSPLSGLLLPKPILYDKSSMQSLTSAEEEHDNKQEKGEEEETEEIKENDPESLRLPALSPELEFSTPDSYYPFLSSSPPSYPSSSSSSSFTNSHYSTSASSPRFPTSSPHLSPHSAAPSYQTASGASFSGYPINTFSPSTTPLSAYSDPSFQVSYGSHFSQPQVFSGAGNKQPPPSFFPSSYPAVAAHALPSYSNASSPSPSSYINTLPMFSFGSLSGFPSSVPSVQSSSSTSSSSSSSSSALPPLLQPSPQPQSITSSTDSVALPFPHSSSTTGLFDDFQANSKDETHDGRKARAAGSPLQSSAQDSLYLQADEFASLLPGSSTSSSLPLPLNSSSSSSSLPSSFIHAEESPRLTNDLYGILGEDEDEDEFESSLFSLPDDAMEKYDARSGTKKELPSVLGSAFAMSWIPI